jgi:hypothetical protein
VNAIDLMWIRVCANAERAQQRLITVNPSRSGMKTQQKAMILTHAIV